ncbi:MAG TPA: DapH/DapD/GlmU-related protein, partial [Planctomycetota bacterium]|nr:DapH/DapD/GlmU-related protein [Planctomycetota bacterium]
VIEDGVHIGSNSVLVAPVRIGKGAKTGAGAVVLRGEVPPGAVMVGVPARAISKSMNGHPKPARKHPAKSGKKRG